MVDFLNFDLSLGHDSKWRLFFQVVKATNMPNTFNGTLPRGHLDASFLLGPVQKHRMKQDDLGNQTSKL